MPRTLPLRLGCAYSFRYPRYNYFGLPGRTEFRRVIVQAVRDTRHEPLEELTVSSNPSLRRGRWLVTGHDLDRDAGRSFYVDSMTDIQPLTAEQREPYRDAEYLVLTSAGTVSYQAARLADATDALVAKSAGILCKVLGIVDRPD